MIGLWIPLGIVAGWFLLCVALTPVTVRAFVQHHKEFNCSEEICRINKSYKNVDGAITVPQACSAKRAHSKFLLIPFVAVFMWPRSVAYGTAHKIRDNELKVKQLEREAKTRELELAKAREVEANRMKTDMMNFDQLMKMVEKGTVKV